ncbi:ABC transporter substrate-binding protein [Asanoa sp. WMMD1127]|uniref:ABC transporter substrate-binding protein n=1 Tax=Asanoa sp. WMMD1127 TaxID=3016107 RepID=UPI0024167223|nr:ABC transporter substrate-binding protein [Asanoa sp. WMMD1127]MDG4825084.1 ABC transporter substrate-binding protein [Asanoa sp. WMMD1127]
MLRRRALLLLAVTVLTSGCGSGAPAATDRAAAAVAVTDCEGEDVNVPRAPRRVVTLDGYAAQVLVRLGLADRIVGTGAPAPFTAENGAFRQELMGIPVLSRTLAPTEMVAAQNPDLVLTGFADFGLAPGSPKAADLRSIGVPGLAACLPDGPAGPSVTDLSPTYDFVLKLGQVFDVPDRAERLVAELREREQAVRKRAGPDRPRVLILQDNPVAGRPIKTSGTGTIAHALILLAGGENVFSDVTSMHADVSPEEVLNRDPQVLWVITDYPFTTSTGDELVRLVKSNPLLASTTAGRQGRVFATSQYLVAFPTPLNVDALERLGAHLGTTGW